jgi:hypothetical protein
MNRHREGWIRMSRVIELLRMLELGATISEIY